MKLVIYGNGDFAKLMYYYFSEDSDYEVCAFCADESYIKEDELIGKPVLSVNNIEKNFPPSEYKIFVAIGYSNMRARKKMYDKVKNKGYQCINYISSKAIIDKSFKLGENNVIFQNVTIEPYVSIGNNNIIWSSTTLCHNVSILSHSFVAAQSVIGGFSIIKDNCFLGFNSTIIENITLEKETLVGAKSLVLNDTEEYSKYMGIPAKKISEHKKEGIKIK